MTCSEGIRDLLQLRVRQDDRLALEFRFDQTHVDQAARNRRLTPDEIQAGNGMVDRQDRAVDAQQILVVPALHAA